MKAILVVDAEEHGDYYADVYRKDADDRFDGRYYLKPLPKKKNTDFHPNVVYANGWNACLKEIENESSICD